VWVHDKKVVDEDLVALRGVSADAAQFVAGRSFSRHPVAGHPSQPLIPDVLETQRLDELLHLLG
jgi:hypothetical protein